MKKGFERKLTKYNIFNLIRHHFEDNDNAFRDETHLIAMIFNETGAPEVCDRIMQYMAIPQSSPSIWEAQGCEVDAPNNPKTSSSNSTTSFSQLPQTPQTLKLVPQLDNLEFLQLIQRAITVEPLDLPQAIQDDLRGLRNALLRDVGMCKFLFQGPPGTGKTESVRQLAHNLHRPLYYVDFTTIIDSLLGQTQKNLVKLFAEIDQVAQTQQAIVIFDEIDALALERVGSGDIREMGRVTSILLRELDRVSSQVVIIATTNLFQYFDKALVRRFDSIVDFSRYTREDLLRAADTLYDHYLTRFKGLARHTRLYKKILNTLTTIPYPGELKNILRTAMAFSDLDSDTNYLARLYQLIHSPDSIDLTTLKQEGYTVREIEILTGISKSQVARNLQE